MSERRRVRTIALEDALEAIIDYRGKTPDKSDAGVLLVTAKVIKGGFIQREENEYIAEETYETWMRRGLPRVGDVLITTEAPLGEVARLDDANVALAQRVILLRARPGVVTPSYLYHLLQGPEVQAELLKRATGTTVAGIKQSELRRVPLSLPDLDEQRRVGAFLDGVCRLIENNLRRIRVLANVVSESYSAWFVRYLFPNHTSTAFCDSPIGRVPHDWHFEPLENFCTKITDGSHKSPPSAPSGRPMVSIKDMDDWGFDLTACRLISEGDFDLLVRNGCRPEKGDVLVAKDGATYLDHIFVFNQDVDVVLLSSIAILRTNDRVLPQFLAAALRAEPLFSRLKQMVSGVAIPRVVLKDFRAFPVLVPPIKLQEKWAEAAVPACREIASLRARNVTLRKLRDLLLPKLLSGEVGVARLPLPTG